MRQKEELQGSCRKQGTARQHLLESLKLRSPALPLDLLDSWPRFKRTWAQIATEKYGEMTGHKFVSGVNACLEALACHYGEKPRLTRVGIGMRTRSSCGRRKTFMATRRLSRTTFDNAGAIFPRRRWRRLFRASVVTGSMCTEADRLLG